jgi:hypothetical protein
MRELRYEWGGSTYAFATPGLIPVIAGMQHASARLDGVLIDVPAPTLLPPPTPSADLERFWKTVRSEIQCGELVRRRLHEVLLQGTPYDHATTDPWEQYRVQPRQDVAGVAAALPPWVGGRHNAPLAQVDFEWLPEMLEARDCSSALLSRLPACSLQTLRDRARAAEAAGAPLVPQPSAGTGARAKPASEMVQEMYVRARLRESESERKLAESEQEVADIRRKLADLSGGRADAAIALGWDGLQELVDAVIGEGTFARALNAIPDEWEEDEALSVLGGLLREPNQSQHVWLLQKAPASSTLPSKAPTVVRSRS